jgi:phage terminase large subunit-like protein
MTAVITQFPTRQFPTLYELRQEYEDYQIAEVISDLPPHKVAGLKWDWEWWARPKQLPPLPPEGKSSWRVWFLMGGRGVGKTWVGSHFINRKAQTTKRIALVGRTASDVRDTMVEGESGLLATSPPWFMPKYEPGKRRVTWPNGCQALCFSADEPSVLRGPQFEAAWADELASWKRPETWDNLLLGLRLGNAPQAVVTSTPRPTKLVKSILEKDSTVVSRESTYENLENLAEEWATDVISQYEGTRLGLQELHAQILDDNPNALWKRETIDDNRVTKYPDLDEIVVAVDPATSEKGAPLTNSETGICVGGRQGLRLDRKSHGYVLDDVSIQGTPEVWAREVVTAYHKWQADRVVAEANNGGALVKYTIQTIDPDVPVELVYASRGKQPRAQPISAMDAQGRIHHVGIFGELEDQMCEWEPGMKSPDRLDARVWLFNALMVGEADKYVKVL